MFRCNVPGQIIARFSITKGATPGRSSARALKNIVFVNFIFNNKKSTSLKSSFGGFSKFCLNGLYAKSDYFLSINFMILLRFTANIAIAPCISMPIRPDDDATS